jgi:hypothetical protein
MANMDLGETSIHVVEDLDMNKRMANREVGEVGNHRKREEERSMSSSRYKVEITWR